MKLLEGNQASIAPCNSFVMPDPRTRSLNKNAIRQITYVSKQIRALQ